MIKSMNKDEIKISEEEKEKEESLLTEEQLLALIEEFKKPLNIISDKDLQDLQKNLLKLVNGCIPVAAREYQKAPKKGNADSLNNFVKQSKDIAHDIQLTLQKQRQLQKLFLDCLNPVFQTLYDQIINFVQNNQGDFESLEEDLQKLFKLSLNKILEKILAEF